MQKKPRLVERILHACEGRRALWALFGISALESSFLPVPIDLAMIPVGLAQRSRMWLVVLVGALGSLVGALIGYTAGALFFQTVGEWIIGLYGLSEHVDQFKVLFLENGANALVVAGLSPIPFKVAAIISGAMEMDLFMFIWVTFAVRTVRFALMGAMVLLFGKSLQRMMKANYAIFSTVLIILMIFGFFVMPMLTNTL